MDEKNFIIEFIEVYRGLPALWQVKSKQYSNRNENAQYEILLKKYQEKYPNAEKKDVAQKINSLRTAYRRELKRIDRLAKSGAGADEESEPNLFYFSAMDFLRDNEQPCASQSTMDGEDEAMNSEELLKKRKKPDSAEELIMLATKRLKEPPGEYDKIAESWALKLKKMKPNQRVYAEKFVSKIIFEGQMETLHRSSMQLNILSSSTTPNSCCSGYDSSQSSDTISCTSSNVSLSRTSTPFLHIPVPLITPQIKNSKAESTHNYTRTDATEENSLTHYFSSFH